MAAPVRNVSGLIFEGSNEDYKTEKVEKKILAPNCSFVRVDNEYYLINLRI
jgi:hypothetical protein